MPRKELWPNAPSKWLLRTTLNMTTIGQLVRDLPVETSTRQDVILEILRRRVIFEMRRRYRRLALGYGALGLLAAAALIPLGQFIATLISDSGLAEYVSLFFSDSVYAVAHWQQFALTVIDSLPISGTIIAVALVLIAISMIRRVVRTYPLILTYSYSS